MIEDQATFRSTLKPAILKKNLFRGTFFGVLALILFFCFYFFPVEGWGFFLVLLGFTFLGYGFLPYRKAIRILQSPSKIVITNGSLVYCEKNTPRFEIPEGLIDQVFYIDKGKVYGIGIKLKESQEEKIKLLKNDPGFKQKAAWNLVHYGSEIFLPFFDEKTEKKVKDLIGTES